MRLGICILLLCLPVWVSAQEVKDENAIIGRWITEKKNLVVDIYRQGAQYRAKIIWFVDHHNPAPAELRTDDKNPVPALRTRKIIGMDVLQGLTYNIKTNRWEDGKIYDASSGKTWNAAAQLTKEGTLAVRGYWEFELFGKTLKFLRYKKGTSE